MTIDPLGVIEELYRVDLDTKAWLGAVGSAVYSQVGAGLGILAFEYTVTDADQLRLGEMWQQDMPAGIGDAMRAQLEQLPDWFVRETYARCDADTASQGGGNERVRERARAGMGMLKQMFGWHDIFVMSGIDPTRHGVYFGAWLDKETVLSARERETWTRIAVHIATAHRLRRRLADAERRTPETADAILRPDGRIDDAREEAADADARRELCESVLGLERARGELRRIDIDQAVESWQGLVSGRWTLVDYFESRGDRYVLARRNDVPADERSLTRREYQAVGYAALGHSNKLIAYEMGISPSTVGVLLHRASTKLGATTREDLLTRFAALSRRNGFTSDS